MNGPALKVFISYSPEDEEFRRALEQSLVLLERQKRIVIWHEGKILPGASRAEAIERELGAADILLLLVSPSFLAERDQEADRALERRAAGAAVIPVLIRPCDWSAAPFGKLVPLPTDGRPVTKWSHRDEAWQDVVQGVRRAVEAREARPPSPAPPAAPPPTAAPAPGGKLPAPAAIPAASGAALRIVAKSSAGLFVGVRDFEDPLLPAVPYAVDDAVDLAHLFALELGLIAPAWVVLLLSGEPQKPESRQRLAALLAAGAARQQPTVFQIYDQLQRLSQATEADGLMVASFATHGFADQGQPFLAVSGAWRRRLVSTGLSLDTVVDDLTRAKAKRRLLLIDACRTRHDPGTRSTAQESLESLEDAFAKAMLRAKGCASLAAASLGGLAYDDPKVGNGVFTKALLDALQGGVEGNEEANVTLGAVADFADGQVRDWVLANKPEHAEISLGILAHYEPPSMRHLPLAIDPKRQSRRLEQAMRTAMAHLVGLVGPSDPLYLKAVAAFAEKRPEAQIFELATEVEAFDGSPRLRRALAAYLEELAGG